MLQKATYETMGPILLSRSQEDSSKIIRTRDLQRKLRLNRSYAKVAEVAKLKK